MTGPDMTREYHTRNGHRVVLDSFKEHNCLGEVLSFPIGGTIFYKDRPRKRARLLWNLQGRAYPLKESPLDLIDLPPVLNAAAPPCMDCCGTPLAPPRTA